MLNTREAAKYLGMNESTLRSWRCKGIGPAFYTMSLRKVVYAEADLEAYKSERRCEPSASGSPGQVQFPKRNR